MELLGAGYAFYLGYVGGIDAGTGHYPYASGCLTYQFCDERRALEGRRFATGGEQAGYAEGDDLFKCIGWGRTDIEGAVKCDIHIFAMRQQAVHCLHVHVP